jgi:hypothetical protein
MDNIKQWPIERKTIYSILASFYRGEIKLGLNILKEHLLSWISSWVEDVDKNAEIKFWVGFAQLTKGWLENDLDEIEKLVYDFCR